MADKYRDTMLILSTNRCSSRCKFCAYHNDLEHITAERPSIEKLIQQTVSFYEAKKEKIESNSEIYIVNSGSFFDERQVPQEYLSWLADFLSEKNLSLIVDSRADLNINKSEAMIRKLRHSTEKVTVAVGIEAYRPDLKDRNALFRRLGKGITEENCIQQAAALHKLGCGVKAYVLIAPPWLEGPSYAKEGYRKNMDWLIETAFETVKFADKKMDVEIIGISPFFPYKGTNALIPADWVPISATEASEIAHQLKQVFPNKRIDYTSRQIHFPFGYFFKQRSIPNPIRADSSEKILSARENVARICKNVFGVRGEISKFTKIS